MKNAILAGLLVVALLSIPIYRNVRRHGVLAAKVRSQPSQAAVATPIETPLALEANDGKGILETAERFSDLDNEGIATLLDRLVQRDGTNQDTVCRVLLTQWAQHDGQGAANWLMQRFDENAKNHGRFRSALKDVISTWTHHDTQSALDWYRDHATVLDKSFGFDMVRCFAPYALADVRGLMLDSFKNTYDETIPEDLVMPNHSAETLARAYEAFANEDPIWSGPALEHALAKKWVSLDLQGATEWAMAQPPGKPVEALLAQIRQVRLTKSDDTAGEANVLLEEQASYLEQENLLTSIAENWPANDLNGLGEWLGQHGANSESWPAIEAFAKRSVGLDPESAFAWLDLVDDSIERERFYGGVFDHWHRKSQEAAETFLAIHEADWPERRMRMLKELAVSQEHDPSGW